MLGRSDAVETLEDVLNITDALEKTARRNGVVSDTMLKHGLKDSEYEGDGTRLLTDEEEKEFFDRALLMNTYWAKSLAAGFFLEKVNMAIDEYETSN